MSQMIVDPNAVAALLERILSCCGEQALCLKAEDFGALSAAMEAQQDNIDALSAAVGEDRSWLDDERCCELVRQINEASAENMQALSSAMEEVSGQRSALKKGIKGIAAYTKQALREDGSFVDRKG